MSNDEKFIFEANGASPLEIARLNEIAHESIREKAIKQQARAEVIEEAKLELLKLVKGLSDPEPYVEFNDVINILTKLKRGEHER